MLMRSPLLLLLAPLMILGGCGDSVNEDSTGILDSAKNYGTQTATTASTPGLMVDAAVQTIINQGAGNDLQTRSLEGAPRLAPRGSASVNVANLTLPNGLKLFPNATGTLSISWTGNAITSWPASTTQVVDVTATVTTTNLTYTDSSAGVTVTVNGSLRFDLDGTISGTNRFNWTSDLTSVMTISSASPLTTTVARQGKTESVSIFGNRKVRQQTTSTEALGTTTLAGRTGTRTFTRTISGTADNPVDSTDTLDYVSLTASKSVTGLGTIEVVWNRSAQLTGRYDFTSNLLVLDNPTTTPTGSPTPIHDRTYLTLKLNGTAKETIGPKTAKDMATLLGAKAESLDL